MAVKKIEYKELMDCAGKNVEFLQCNISKPLSDFFDSWSPYNITNIKKLNKKTNKQEYLYKTKYCKDCLGKIYARYKEEFGTAEKALFYTCQMANIPFIAEKVEATFNYVSSEAKRGAIVKNIFGTYYSNLLKETSKHHLWQDFSCTDIDYKDIASHIEKRDITKKEMERFELDWGKQNEVEDYEFLEYRYNIYTKDIPLTASQETLYRKLCICELSARKKEELGESTNDETKQILTFMKTLKIDNFNERKEKSDFDLLFERQIWEMENFEPCEVVDLDMYKDMCNIESDWGREIKRSVQNLIAGSKDYPTIEKIREIKKKMSDKFSKKKDLDE